MSLISANLLVVGTATYTWIERWTTKSCAHATQRVISAHGHNATAEGVTYNSDLTRISTSGRFPTEEDGDLDDSAENPSHDETRPLFMSLGEVRRGDESYELSEDRRWTV